MADDSMADGLRRFVYKNWAESHQPMIDDEAKKHRKWDTMDYVTSPWTSMKVGAGNAAAYMIGDQNGYRPEEASAARAQLLREAEEAAMAKKKVPNGWSLLLRKGELP